MFTTSKRCFFIGIWLCSIATLFAQDFVETAKLYPNARHASQRFGHAVGISGNYAITGAHREQFDANEENAIEDAGAAYIFEKENEAWVFKQKLVQEHRWFVDNFGIAVSIEGDYAVVGIFGEDMDDPNEANVNTSYGAAMIYKRDANGIGRNTN
ncbi:hypothetical protein N7U66_03340 [Lacinutrix neustonica]|uniref:Uncharacterized protein n=1 Tax=Lacinutrix neustonica TaxID=2980107 RepID=A0A9E8SDS3_9FLAO|nr:FG-GAP repeat protein [Lacinutrix neustonica]WAC02718.1 hypothetical protein N7U66_03340 [Lacinutrix neustonica]